MLTSFVSRRGSGKPALRRLALTGTAALLLAGCANTRPVVDTGVPADYRKAHPIVLTQAQRSIDIFVDGGPGAIGARQIGDVRAFAAEYRRSGTGPLIIAMPANNPAAYRIVHAVRRALAEGGVSAPQTASYAPADPSPMSPIKLTFAKLQAKVDSECGLWPGDLAGMGGTVDGWRNRSWENFGCATQTALAAQVADPLDLARPRPDAPASAARRVVVMGKYIKGEPTATIDPDAGKEKISTAVGQ